VAPSAISAAMDATPRLSFRSWTAAWTRYHLLQAPNLIILRYDDRSVLGNRGFCAPSSPGADPIRGK
jgi:hypothetical protein